MKVFENFADYYDIFYRDKDYESEIDTLLGLLKGKIKEDALILDMGCGTGRHAFELNKRGYTVHGIDLSEEMIHIAENKYREIESMTFAVDDIRQYQSEQKFNLVLSLFHVLSYQNTNEDICKAFRTAYNCLEENGLFVFDCWYGPGVLTDHPYVKITEAEDERYTYKKIAKPQMDANKNIVKVDCETMIVEKSTSKMTSIEEIHSMRYLFEPEVEYMLNHEGFILEKACDCKTMGKLDYNSWTAYFIARKKK